jgi:hypothetical protein
LVGAHGVMDIAAFVGYTYLADWVNGLLR